MADYSVNTEIRANVSNFQKGMAKAEQSLKTFSKGISTVTKAVGALFAVKGITSFTKSISEMAGSFNEASAVITKGTGATGEKLKELTATVTDAMRGGVGRATQEIGSMVADLNTRFGVTGEELTTLVGDFDKFNNVTGVETTKAIEEVADVMGKWNVDTKQADYLLDQLLVASQESGASIEELTNGLKQGQAIFSKFGMNVTRSTAFLASLKKNGIDSSTAITAMKTALANFSKEGKDAERELEKVSAKIKNAKSETEALKIATEVFGARAGAEMVRVLQDNGKGADELQKKLRGAKGALKETEAASRTTKDALKDLKASVTALFSGFTGDNTLRDLVDGITSSVSKLNTEELNNSLDTFKGNLGKVLSYSAEILTTLYDNFKQIFEDISDLLDKNSEIVDKWKDNFYKSINSLYRIVQSAFGMIQALIHGNWKMMWEYAKLVVLEIVKAIYDNMASLFQDLEDKINNVITFLKLPVAKNLPLVGELRAALEGLNLLFGKNEQTSAALGKSIDEVTNNINALAAAEQNYAPIAIKDLGTQSSHIAKLSSLFKKHGKVVTAVTEETSDAITTTNGDIETATDEVKKYYGALVQYLKDLQGTVAENITQFVSNALNYTSSLIENVSNKLYTSMPEWAQVAVKSFADSLKWAYSITAGIIKQISKVLSKAVKGAMKLVKGVFVGLTAYAKAYVKIFSTTIKTITGLLTKGFNVFKKILSFNLDEGLNILLAFEDSVLTFFVITLPKLPQYVSTVLQSIGSLVKSLSNSVKAENVATVLFDAIESLKTSLPGVMSDINTLIKGAIEFMTQNGANLIYNFLTVMGENVPEMVSNTLELLKTTIISAVDGIILWLNDGGLATIFSMALDFQDKLQELITTLLANIATFLTDHTADIGNFMANSIQLAFEMLPDLIDSLLKIITALIQSIADCFKNKEMVDSIVNGIVKGIEKILDNIGPLISAVIDLIFSLIAAIVPRLPEIILKIVAAIAKALPGIVGDIANALVGGFKQIFDKIFTKDFWIDTFSHFGDAVGEVATTVGKVFDVSAATGQKKSGGEIAADIGLGVLTGGMYNIVKGLGKNVFHWWADGTDNAPAGLSVVGEAGPELVNFNGGEQVLSNRNTNKLLAGMQGGKTNNFNVVFNNVQDTSAYAMMQQFKNYNRQMAINGVI